MSRECFTLPSLSAEHGSAGASSAKSVGQNKAIVKKEKLTDVVDKDKWEIRNHLDEKYEPYKKEDIVEKAEKLVGSEIEYNAFTKNCEHFVTLLRYGEPQSQQVQLFSMTSQIESY